MVDDVKTSESQRSMHIENEMLDVLKTWKQATQFSGPEDWMFASPVQLGRLRSPTQESGGSFDGQRSGLEPVTSVSTGSVTRTGRGWIRSAHRWAFSNGSCAMPTSELR